MTPTVGRVVHYQSYGTPGGEYPSVPRAAIITAVSTTLLVESAPPDGLPMVDLCVLNPEGMFFNRGVPYADPPRPGCWSWPPRV